MYWFNRDLSVVQEIVGHFTFRAIFVVINYCGVPKWVRHTEQPDLQSRIAPKITLAPL